MRKILHIFINEFSTLGLLQKAVKENSKSGKYAFRLVTSKKVAEDNLRKNEEIRHFWWEYDRKSCVYILHETLFD